MRCSAIQRSSRCCVLRLRMSSMPGSYGWRDLTRPTALRIVPPLSSCAVLGCSLLLLSTRISNGKASFSSRPPSALTWGESHVPYWETSQEIRLPRLTAKKGKTWGRCGVFFQGIWPRMRGYVACHTSPVLADSVSCHATTSSPLLRTTSWGSHYPGGGCHLSRRQ